MTLQDSIEKRNNANNQENVEPTSEELSIKIKGYNAITTERRKKRRREYTEVEHTENTKDNHIQEMRGLRRKQLYELACHKMALYNIAWTNLPDFLTFCKLFVYDETKDKCCKIQHFHMPILENGTSTEEYVQQLMKQQTEQKNK